VPFVDREAPMMAWSTWPIRLKVLQVSASSESGEA
jgi:hypothetical protein